MSLEGQIEETGLGPIIQTLSLNRYRGTLRIETEAGSQFFFISEGEIVLVRQVKRDPVRLGDLLVTAGHLSEDQLGQALAEQRNSNSGRRLGETMVELGLVTQAQIEQAVRDKFEEDFLDLFLVDEGRFEFIFGLTPEALFGPDERLERITLSTSSLMMEAMRRVDEWQEMIQTLGNFDTIFRNRIQSIGSPIQDYEFEGVTLPTHTRVQIYEMLTGDRSLREVMAAALEGGVATRLQTFLYLHELQKSELIKPLDFKMLLASAKEALAGGHVSAAAKFIRAILGRKERIDLALVQRYLRFLIDQQRPRLAFDEARRFAAQSLADGEAEAAITLYESALALYASVEVIDRLFYALLRANRRDRAVEVGLQLREFLQSEGDLAVAQRVLQNLQELDPDNPGVIELRGLILVRLERHEEAIPVLDQALNIVPDAHPRRPKLIAALLELAPEREDLLSAKEKLELSEARRQVARERRLRYIGIFATICVSLLIWRGYAEWTSRAVYARARSVLEEVGDQAEVSDLTRVSVLLGGVSPFTTVSGSAQELAEEVRQQSEGLERETRLRVDELIRRQQQEVKAAEAARQREAARERLRADMGEFQSMQGDGRYKEASAKAVEIAKDDVPRDDPGLAREFARLRVFAEIESEPPGATVILGGEALGATPLVVPLPLGRPTTLQVRRAGYRTEEVTLAGEGYVERKLTLSPGATWRVDLDAPPAFVAESERGPLVVSAKGELTLRDITTGRAGEPIELPGSGAPVGGQVSGPLAVLTRGRLVLGLNLPKRRIDWRHEVQGEGGLQAPTIGLAVGQRVAVICGGTQLTVLEIGSGSVLMHLTGLPDVATQPATILDGWAFLPLKGRVVALSLAPSGEQTWGSLPRDARWERPVVADRGLLALPTAGALVAVLEGGELRVLDRRNGVTTPVAPALGPLAGILEHRGSLYCLGQRGQLASYRSDGLEVLAPKSIGQSASAGPVLLGSELLGVNGSGLVVRFSLAGKRRSETDSIQLGAVPTQPLLRQGNGVLIVVGKTLAFVEPQEH